MLVIAITALALVAAVLPYFRRTGHLLPSVATIVVTGVVLWFDLAAPWSPNSPRPDVGETPLIALMIVITATAALLCLAWTTWRLSILVRVWMAVSDEDSPDTVSQHLPYAITSLAVVAGVGTLVAILLSLVPLPLPSECVGACGGGGDVRIDVREVAGQRDVFEASLPSGDLLRFRGEPDFTRIRRIATVPMPDGVQAAHITFADFPRDSLLEVRNATGLSREPFEDTESVLADVSAPTEGGTLDSGIDFSYLPWPFTAVMLEPLRGLLTEADPNVPLLYFLLVLLLLLQSGLPVYRIILKAKTRIGHLAQRKKGVATLRARDGSMPVRRRDASGLVTLREACTLLGRRERVVVSWCRNGAIPFDIGNDGAPNFWAEDLEDLLRTLNREPPYPVNTFGQQDTTVRRFLVAIEGRDWEWWHGVWLRHKAARLSPGWHDAVDSVHSRSVGSRERAAAAARDAVRGMVAWEDQFEAPIASTLLAAAESAAMALVTRDVIDSTQFTLVYFPFEPFVPLARLIIDHGRGILATRERLSGP
jgi:hypothetical protein